MGAYYCDFCKVYVRDDKFTRRQHEASDRHRGALERHVSRLSRQKERDDRDRARIDSELRRAGGKTSQTTTSAPARSGAAKAAVQNTRAVPVAELSVDKAPVAKKIKLADGTTTKAPKVLDDSSFYTAAIAAKQPNHDHEVKYAIKREPLPEDPVDEVGTSAAGSTTPAVDTVVGDDFVEIGPSTQVKAEHETDADADAEPVPRDRAAEAADRLRKRRPGIGEDYVNFKVQARVVEAAPVSAAAANDLVKSKDGETTAVVFKKRKPKVKAEA